MQSAKLNAHRARFLTTMLQLLVEHCGPQEMMPLTRDIQKFCRYLDKKYLQREQQPDDVRIVEAVRAGYVTSADIAQHALIPYNTVTKILKALSEPGALTVTRKPTESGRGGDRKTKLYWLNEKTKFILDNRTSARRPNVRMERKKTIPFVAVEPMVSTTASVKDTDSISSLAATAGNRSGNRGND